MHEHPPILSTSFQALKSMFVEFKCMRGNTQSNSLRVSSAYVYFSSVSIATILSAMEAVRYLNKSSELANHSCCVSTP